MTSLLPFPRIESAGASIATTPPGARRESREPWRAVARHAGWRIDQGVVQRVPNGAIHAKRIGTAQAACGETAVSWQVFWSTVFPDDSAGAANCPECVAIVGSARQPG